MDETDGESTKSEEMKVFRKAKGRKGAGCHSSRKTRRKSMMTGRRKGNSQRVFLAAYGQS